METTKNIFKVIGVTALAGMVITGIVLGCIFGLNTNEKVNDSLEPTEESSPFEIETTVENGIRLSSSEATIASDGTISKELTAIIMPDNASNKKVSWSCAWENASDSWASGKNVSNYVAVTSSGDNSLKATVVCMEAFGTPIVVTVRTTDGSNLSAGCKCDYVKRVEKVDLTVPKTSMADDNCGFDTSTTPAPWYVKMYATIPDTGQSNFTTSIVWSVGTIEEDVDVSVSYYLTDQYYNCLATLGYNLGYSNGVFSGDRYDSGVVTFFNTDSNGVREMFGSNFYDDLDYQSAVCRALNIMSVAAMKFKVTAIGEYNNYSVEYQCGINTSRMTIAVQSVALENETMKF